VHSISHEILLPPIQLYCETETCNGIRIFEPLDDAFGEINESKEHFVKYKCRNCEESIKTYALKSYIDADRVNGNLYKFGETPSFGPPIPAKVITLVGSEREYYLKGRRAESQGLGIAAFAYYRRVIENQKKKIFEEIIRVSVKLNAQKDLLDELNAAKTETQFSKAVSIVKHGIPQALLVNGHNPLTLLHSALSEGLHAQTDKQCLELATTIRIVLTDFVERISNTLKDDTELNSAITRLLQIKSNQSKKG